MPETAMPPGGVRPGHHPKSHCEPRWPQGPGNVPGESVHNVVYIPPLFFQLNAGEPAVDSSKSTQLRKLVLFLFLSLNFHRGAFIFPLILPFLSGHNLFLKFTF